MFRARIVEAIHLQIYPDDARSKERAWLLGMMERASTRRVAAFELAKLRDEISLELTASEKNRLADALVEEPELDVSHQLFQLLRNHADPRLDELAERVLETVLSDDFAALKQQRAINPSPLFLSSRN